MNKDRIEGRDIANEQWMACRGRAIEQDERAAGGVVAVRMYEGTASTTGFLDQKETARLGVFLFEAAGVDIVSAARNFRDELQAMTTDNDQAYAQFVRTLRMFPKLQRAFDGIATELAKFDTP